MLRKIYNWLVGNWCRHEFEVFDEADIYAGLIIQPNEIPYATDYVLRCKKCGEITKRRV